RGRAKAKPRQTLRNKASCFAAAAAAAHVFFCVQQQQLREESAATSEKRAATKCLFGSKGAITGSLRQHIMKPGRKVDILDGILDRFFNGGSVFFLRRNFYCLKGDLVGAYGVV